MLSSTVRVGIVGHGFATTTFHAPLIESVPGLELVAISSSDPEKVRVLRPHVDAPASPQALFDRADIDLIVIPTPNDTHHPLAAAALSAGKHVVVDKPFTLTLAEADDLIDRATQANRLLSVFHNRRWDTDFLTVQQLIQSGLLGRLTHLSSHFDRYRPLVRDRWRESGGPGSGLWFDLGPHILDQALTLFGEPEHLKLELAHQRDNARADDWCHATLRYANGLRVTLHATALAAIPGARFTLHGTLGSYIKHGLDPQEDALKAGGRPGIAGWGEDPTPGTLTLAQGEALVSTTYPSLPGDHSRYYAGIRDAMLGQGPNPVTAHEARTVMAWLERAYRQAATD